MDSVGKSKFNVDYSKIDMDDNYAYPAVVPGRVVHIDCDFIAYQVSAESKDELDPEKPHIPRKSFEDMCHNARRAAEHTRKLAGAEHSVLHTTPTGTTKGGRNEQAVQKEYQGNRKSRDNKPEFLDAVRAWMATELRAVPHLDQEADDGMAQAAWQAYWDNKQDLCVIASKDKDLLMVPGWHLLGENLRKADDLFGYIELDDSKSSKKVVGLGTKFFWAQCLMGDAADNIMGIPAVSAKSYLPKMPTKAYMTQVDKFKAGDEKAKAKLLDMLAKTKTCGAVMAYELLKDCKSDKECFDVVTKAYKEINDEPLVFTHWATAEPVTWSKALFSDMQLLWMRRKKDPNDVLVWLKEVGCL